MITFMHCYRPIHDLRNDPWILLMKGKNQNKKDGRLDWIAKGFYLKPETHHAKKREHIKKGMFKNKRHASHFALLFFP